MHSPQKVKTSKDAFESNNELLLNLVTADDVQILCVDPRGVLPRHGILKLQKPLNFVTADHNYALANPVGRTPGRFAKKC